MGLATFRMNVHNTSMRKSMIMFLKGMGIGAANVVPGVSGGTMAVVFGVYEQVIHSISTFFKDWKANTLFLLPLVVGIGAGIIVFANVISMALEYAPMHTMFFFIGLILGSFPALLSEVRMSAGRRFGVLDACAFVLGLGIMIILSFLPESSLAASVLPDGEFTLAL